MESENNYVKQSQEIIEYLINELIITQNKLRDYELRINTIQHYLTSEVTSKRYGEIKDNE